MVLVCLTIYDEDTLQIEHMLTLITACGLLVSVSRIFIPPEVRDWFRVLAHIITKDSHWLGSCDVTVSTD